MTMSAAGHLLRVTALNTGAYAPYAPLLALQELLADQRRAKQIPDTLLQLEVRAANPPPAPARTAAGRCA